MPYPVLPFKGFCEGFPRVQQPSRDGPGRLPAQQDPARAQGQAVEGGEVHTHAHIQFGQDQAHDQHRRQEGTSLFSRH